MLKFNGNHFYALRTNQPWFRRLVTKFNYGYVRVVTLDAFVHTRYEQCSKYERPSYSRNGNLSKTDSYIV